MIRQEPRGPQGGDVLENSHQLLRYRVLVGDEKAVAVETLEVLKYVAQVEVREHRNPDLINIIKFNTSYVLKALLLPMHTFSNL
jgi:hypothetical protein